jgi:lysophospholipase L1-like esterase
VWIKKYQDWKRIFEDKAAGYYTWPSLPDSIYRKLPNQTWQVKRPTEDKFIDLSRGNTTERIENLENLAQDRTVNLLFVGDSNTASAAGGKFYGWWIAQELNNRASRPRVTVDRVAKGGEGTDWMIDNLRTHLAQKKGKYYDIITILGGSNDIWNGPHPKKAEVVQANIQTLVKMVKAHGARAVVVSPPSKEFYVNKMKANTSLSKENIKDQEIKLSELSKLVKWEAETYGNRFINFNWITSPGGGATIENFEKDARHLKPDPMHKKLGDLWINKIFWGLGPV